MNNDELKKKICEVIADVWVRNDIMYGNWQLGFTEKIADTLIAAGIGDVSDYKALKVELHQKVDYINELWNVKEDFKHRAEVAERALKIAEELGELCAPAKDYIKQAEKELAEEGKE